MRFASLILLIASLTAAAQGPPVALDEEQADPWSHYLGPYRSIHLVPEERNTTPNKVRVQRIELQVIISANGRVDAAHAVEGPEQFYDEAERIELARTFKPFLHEGTPHTVHLVDTVFILPPERWREPHLLFPTQIDLSHTAITLERNVCKGPCPKYKVTIFGDGSIHFQGDYLVLTAGQHTAHVPVSAVRGLLDAFRQADFLSALPEYVARMTDPPAQVLTLTLNGTAHAVADDQGLAVGLPDAIGDLERQVDEAAGTERWVTGNDLTLPSLKAESWPFQSGAWDNIALYDMAIERHDDVLIETLLQAKAPPAATFPLADHSPAVDAPLCVASGLAEQELVERMIETTRVHGKMPSFPQPVLDACLAASAQNGSLPLVDQWLEHGANPLASQPNSFGEPTSILAHAIDSGNPNVVARILRYPADLHERLRENQSLLHYAANQPDAPTHSPLRDASAIVALLLRAGADVQARDDGGRTALFCHACGPSTIAALIAAGAKVDERDNGGETPLIRNADDLSHVQALLTAGADPTAATADGLTPLLMAKRYKCPACVTALEAAIKKAQAQ